MCRIDTTCEHGISSLWTARASERTLSSSLVFFLFFDSYSKRQSESGKPLFHKSDLNSVRGEEEEEIQTKFFHLSLSHRILTICWSFRCLPSALVGYIAYTRGLLWEKSCSLLKKMELNSIISRADSTLSIQNINSFCIVCIIADGFACIIYHSLYGLPHM